MIKANVSHLETIPALPGPHPTHMHCLPSINYTYSPWSAWKEHMPRFHFILVVGTECLIGSNDNTGGDSLCVFFLGFTCINCLILRNGRDSSWTWASSLFSPDDLQTLYYSQMDFWIPKFIFDKSQIFINWLIVLSTLTHYINIFDDGSGKFHISSATV